jgi:hypothetical protein
MALIGCPLVAGLGLSRPITFGPISADGPTSEKNFRKAGVHWIEAIRYKGRHVLSAPEFTA